MDRKQFLRASLGAGTLCGARTAAGEEAQAGVQTPAGPPVTPCQEKAAFARVWIQRFMETLDAQVPEPKRAAILEARGRSCARRGPIKMAEEAKGDVDRVVATMAGHLGPQNARREGRLVHIIYPHCYCPMVTDVTEKLSPTYCHCSAGWLKEIFETVSGKPAAVEIVETIKRGASQCHLIVKLEA